MIIGGAAGAAIGGPIGGLLGAAAGIAVERGFVTPALTANTEKDASRGVAFTVAVIALSAKMAKADGMVTRDEISAFRERVHIPPSEVPQVGRFWDLARQTKEGYEGYATQVARMFSPRAPVLEQLLDLLFHIAGSDGSLTAPEIEYLARVSEIFGFTEEDFHRWLALHGDEGRARGTCLASIRLFRMTSSGPTGKRLFATITPTSWSPTACQRNLSPPRMTGWRGSTPPMIR